MALVCASTNLFICLSVHEAFKFCITLILNILFLLVSNHVPDTAVIAPTSGTVFEKRLIEKLLAENGGKDPINGEPLDIDQLIEIKGMLSCDYVITC